MIRNFFLTSLFFIAFFWIGNFSLASEPTRPSAPYVNSQTVREWQRQGKEVVMVDVREKKEYDAGHMQGAMNVPYPQVEQRLNEFKKAQSPSYVVYCTYSAWRAPYAANVLADAGYKNVYVLEGGVSAWNAGGQVIYASNPRVKPAVVPYNKNLVKILHHPKDRVYDQKIKLTLEELQQYDGKDGRPAYVAVKGVIYDVTESRLWRGGVHAPSKAKTKAFAGRDVTKLIEKSPHGEKPLKEFPVVGDLVSS